MKKFALCIGALFFAGISVHAVPNNAWPNAESPDHAIDGVGQKYLNFAKLNTGIVVTPSLGTAHGTIATGLQLWMLGAVPEASTLALLGLSTLGVLGLRRRR